MADARLSVRDLLGMPAGGDLLAGLPEDELKEVRGSVHGVPWSAVETAVGDKLSEALDIDPVILFAAAWEKYSLLSDAAKESKDGGTVLVPMAEHEVKSELHPYVDIQLGSLPPRRIDFDLTLTLKLKGLVVKVESEEIRGIQTGTCEGSAEIGLASKSLWKHDIKPVPLPGNVAVKIPIRSR